MTTSGPRKIIVFGHTPPPHHGQSYMTELLIRKLSEIEKVEIHHINARFAENAEDIGSIKFHKIVMVAKYLIETLQIKICHNVQIFYYCPAPVKRSAIFRDLIVLPWAKLLFKRVILHWHAAGLGEWTSQHHQNIIDRALVTAVKTALHKVSLSIVLSEYAQKDSDVFSPQNTAVVPNGVPDACPDFESDTLKNRNNRLNKRYSTAQNQSCSYHVFRSLYLAHCVAEKGLFDCIDAVIASNLSLRADKKNIRISLDIAGQFLSSQDRARFEQRIKEKDYQELIQDSGDLVRYLGFISGDDKRKLLSNSDCLLFPSYYPAEVQPVSILECMAFGMPFIVSNWKGLPELTSGLDLPVCLPAKVNSITSSILEVIEFRDFAKIRKKYLRYYHEDSFRDSIHDAIFQK